MDVLLPLLPPCSRSSPLFLSSFTAAINRLLSLMSSSFPLVGSFCVQVSPQNMSTPHHRLSNNCISNNSRTHTLPDSVVGFGLMLARLISTPRMPTWPRTTVTFKDVMWLVTNQNQLWLIEMNLNLTKIFFFSAPFWNRQITVTSLVGGFVEHIQTNKNLERSTCPQQF